MPRKDGFEVLQWVRQQPVLSAFRTWFSRSGKGIINGDQIRLLEPTGLEDGTLVELTITVRSASEQARERQRLLLQQGLHLGGPPYPDREQLHER